MTEPDFTDNDTKATGAEPADLRTDMKSTGKAREYEQSGLYPATGKPFRLWALLGWLTLLIIVLAGVSAMLNFLLI